MTSVKTRSDLASTLVLWLVVLLLTGCPAGPQTVSSPHPVGERGTDGRLALELAGRPLWVAVASTPTERQRGLQDVAALADDEGMLFVYDDLDIRRYWMKDCRLDLDIVWVDAHGEVLGITEIVAPKPGSTDAEIPRAVSPEPAAFVLEVARGWCRRFGAVRGTTLRGIPTHASKRSH